MDDELFERYRMDGEPRIFERLVEQYRPLVYSVCRRYLRNPEDVEDAVQETFVKLVTHMDEVYGQVGGWLAATAGFTSVDMIRRSMREQRRREMLGRIGPVQMERQLCHQAIGGRLHEALLMLDETARQLIIERFFRKTPLRVIAGKKDVSVATVSREVHRALGDLASVLQDMGLKAVDDLTLVEHFGDPVNLPERSEAGEQGLRFASDWRALATGPWGKQMPDLKLPCLPGWSRPVRVGVFVGYCSVISRGYRGNIMAVEDQVRSTGLMTHPGFQFVGIVESGTTQYGMIERTLREYDLTSGLIESTDLEGLKTLDVISLGLNFAISSGTTKAIAEAVHSGVGLYNEYWTGMVEGHCEDEYARQLMLADSRVYAFHTPLHCGEQLTATVQLAHPTLPGLTPGMSFATRGCGPVYQVRKDATVLVTKDHVVDPSEHHIAGLGPAHMPVCIAGQLGTGRVLVANILMLGTHTHVPDLRSDFMIDLLPWLAKPRQ